MEHLILFYRGVSQVFHQCVSDALTIFFQILQSGHLSGFLILVAVFELAAEVRPNGSFWHEANIPTHEPNVRYWG